MRLIGHLTDEPAAHVFRDYLYVKGIQNQIEHEGEGWAIWIGDEDKIEQAASLLAVFQNNPSDPKYRAEAEEAAKLREEADELARAQSPEDVVHEAADVIYMALVALARGGGTLADVRAELARRHRAVSRRPMARKT
jgi:phosphoribosyl-ATP pyrophosphohydrolase